MLSTYLETNNWHKIRCSHCNQHGFTNYERDQTGESTAKKTRRGRNDYKTPQGVLLKRYPKKRLVQIGKKLIGATHICSVRHNITN